MIVNILVLETMRNLSVENKHPKNLANFQNFYAGFSKRVNENRKPSPTFPSENVGFRINHIYLRIGMKFCNALHFDQFSVM